MTRHVALVRGINVGGKMLAMADLRALLAELEFTDVKTLLQSGNAVFESKGRKPAQIERLIEAQLQEQLGLECGVMVRTAAEWQQIVARNPFAAHAKADPGHLLVMCLRDAPSPARVKALQAAIAGPEQMRADGRQAYFVYPAGVGTSKLTHAVIEKALETRGTARNWNTVLKVAALLGA